MLCEHNFINVLQAITASNLSSYSNSSFDLIAGDRTSSGKHDRLSMDHRKEVSELKRENVQLRHQLASANREKEVKALLFYWITFSMTSLIIKLLNWI